MAWCRQATSHYLSQCWPRSLSPYGVTRPQWVKLQIGEYGHTIHQFTTSWKFICRAHQVQWDTHKGPVHARPVAETWWRHQMETCSTSLALCAGNSPVTGEFPSQRPVMRSFDVFFDLRMNKRLSKQSWGWCFEMPSSSLWLHCNEQSKICFLVMPNKHHALLNHQQLNCLFNNFLLWIQRKHQSSVFTDLLWWESTSDQWLQWCGKCFNYLLALFKVAPENL